MNISPAPTDIMVEVEGERISVSLAGTNFRTVYVKLENGLTEAPFMSNDITSEVLRSEYEATAWAAALEKARELGWFDGVD